jgi:hypothetical protein
LIRYNLLITVLLAIMTSGLCHAQKIDKSDLVISGHGWCGYDIEQLRSNMKSYTYMTYEAAVGFQTEPEDGCAYAHAFGYPMKRPV